MPTVACDWDDTCVTGFWPGEGEWIDGAADALREISRHADVLIHSCRAVFPEGAAAIRRKLDQAGLQRVKIHEYPGKPIAMAYVDDKAVRFTRWPETLPETLRLVHVHNLLAAEKKAEGKLYQHRYVKPDTPPGKTHYPGRISRENPGLTFQGGAGTKISARPSVFKTL